VETRPAHGGRVLAHKRTLRSERGFLISRSRYRPLGLVGPTVDPLGDEFSRLLPDGFCMLLAPALDPPALKFEGAVPDGAWPVVVPFDIDPVGGAAPTCAVPLAPPLALAPPLCANATVLVNVSAIANIVTAFIFIPVSFSAVIGDKLSRKHMFLALTRMRFCARVGVCGREFLPWNFESFRIPPKVYDRFKGS